MIAESNNVREMIQNRIRQQQSGSIDTPVVHGTGVFIWPCNGGLPHHSDIGRILFSEQLFTMPELISV